MKKIVLFLLFLIPWLIIGFIFPINHEYYGSLVLPSFTPPNVFFIIAWSIIYILNATNLTLMFTNFNKQDLLNYYKPFIVNYIANLLFMFFFMYLKNNFLAFIDTIIILISLLFVYYENKSMDKLISKLLIPYIILSIFATGLSLSIYFLNL